MAVHLFQFNSRGAVRSEKKEKIPRRIVKVRKRSRVTVYLKPFDNESNERGGHVGHYAILI